MLLSKRDELERAQLSPNLPGTSGNDLVISSDAREESAIPLPTQPVKVSPAQPVAPAIAQQEEKSNSAIASLRESLAENAAGDEATPAASLNRVFTEAVRLDASDIHIVPEKEYLSVRFRLNGIFHEVAEWDINLHDTILSRLKVISGLQVVERNIPQDGHLEILLEGPPKKSERGDLERSFIEFNFRVSTMPTVNGEVAVLRALNKEKGLLLLEQIGLSNKTLQMVKKIVRRGHGVFLVTGHSGSGKSTTLYSILNYLNTREKAILTLEDPVEYRLDNVRQSQVSPQFGFSFEVGLKAILRQDPDMIMIGEIRDEVTADTAMRLALVGRLVLTTLHTNSIAGALVRLAEMDIERSIISSALTGIMAERLVRKICDTCRVETQPPFELMRMFDIQWTGEKVYAGRGCEACFHTGFKGRTGIFEIMEVDDEFRNLIIRQAPSDEIDAHIKKRVPETLLEDGFNKVRAGITTLEEVIQAVI
ncbi:GspE/PulE family protein [bacterium]|nr:GspE/PulE family protein [bacterium]